MVILDKNTIYSIVFHVLPLYTGSRYGRYGNGKRKTRAGYKKKKTEKDELVTYISIHLLRRSMIAMAFFFHFASVSLRSVPQK